MIDQPSQEKGADLKQDKAAGQTGRRNMFFVVLAVIILFVVSFWAAKIIIKVQEINRGEATLQGDATKLEQLDLDLPKTKKNLVTTDDPSAGSPEAKVHIVEFSDFQCPYCKQSYPIVEQLINEYGQRIHFVYRDFPIPSHAYARKAAEAAECAQEQNQFWQIHNLIFDNQAKMAVVDLKSYAQKLNLDMIKFNSCLDSGKYAPEVEADFKDGLAAGVRGTPTFFINGQMIFGSVPREEMKAAIDQELAKTK